MKDLDIRQLVGISTPILGVFTNTVAGTMLARTFRGGLERYDILVSHQQPAHWIAYRTKRPYVVQIHSIPTVLYPDYLDQAYPLETDYDRLAFQLVSNFDKLSFVRRIDHTAVRYASTVLVPSGGKVTKAVRDIYGVRPTSIPYGIDFSYYSCVDPASVFARYSVKYPMILMVTRPVPAKRADLMIRILPKILREHPAATLVIASTKGPCLSAWHDLARRLGVVSSIRIVSPTKPELDALYSGASVCVYPSQAPETMGRAIIEAMYFRVPPVVWDNGWGPSEVVKDGVGLRARPYDADDFLDKILALLNDDDKREYLGRQGRRHVIRTFSWDRVGPMIEEVLQNCCQ